MVIQGHRIHRIRVDYSEREGSYEHTDRFHLTSVKMAETSPHGWTLSFSLANQLRSHSKWVAVATNSTPLARYRRAISRSGWCAQCVWGQWMYSCCLLGQKMVRVYQPAIRMSVTLPVTYLQQSPPSRPSKEGLSFPRISRMRKSISLYCAFLTPPVPVVSALSLLAWNIILN